MSRLLRVLRRLAERRAFPNLVIVGRDVPDVPECYGGHRTRSGIALYGDVDACPQCNGSHRHQWVRCVVLDNLGSFIGDARRCRICGGRQCDVSCLERRHHSGPHVYPNGAVRRVGA